MPSTFCQKKESRQVNADLFVLTYGSLVTQLLRDIEDVDAVNAQQLGLQPAAPNDTDGRVWKTRWLDVCFLIFLILYGLSWIIVAGG